MEKNSGWIFYPDILYTVIKAEYVKWWVIIIIGIQPLGRSGQRPELSQATGMALVRCILGKFLGVVCHCFPPKMMSYVKNVFLKKILFSLWRMRSHSTLNLTLYSIFFKLFYNCMPDDGHIGQNTWYEILVTNLLTCDCWSLYYYSTVKKGSAPQTELWGLN